MPSPRVWFGCGIVRTASGKAVKAVVAGGSYPKLTSVDILDLATHTWRSGKFGLLGICRNS